MPPAIAVPGPENADLICQDVGAMETGADSGSVYPVIGMSPGNSFFNDVHVRELLSRVIGRHGRAAILVADLPAISTYEALGYSHHEARNKAVLKGNNLKNRTRRIAAELGLPAGCLHIVDWSAEVEGQAAYLAAYSALREAMEQHPALTRTINHTTAEVLGHSGKVEPCHMEEAIARGRHYLVAELAFLDAAPALLCADEVNYVYHRHWPVFEDYLAGGLDGVRRPHLGFDMMPASDEMAEADPCLAAAPAPV